MAECFCTKYVGKTESEMQSCNVAAEVRKNLLEVATESPASHGGYPNAVFRCGVCGMFSARSYFNLGITTIEYFFPIKTSEPSRWLDDRNAKEIRDGEEARKNRNLAEFKKFLNSPRVGEKCRAADCGRDRMKLSVFCPIHHWENASGPLPEDLAALPVK